MKSPFSTTFRITQDFGANPAYYKQFGFMGHEGIDMIPTPPTIADRTIYSVEDGVVVIDTDKVEEGRSYGIYVVIWNPKTKRSWWYCHLKHNTVKINQIVSTGQAIGEMGNTGNSMGAHLHLGLRLTDENGKVINFNNGYKGFIDPKPILVDLTIGKGRPMSYHHIIANEFIKLSYDQERDEFNDRWNEGELKEFVSKPFNKILWLRKENAGLRRENTYLINEIEAAKAEIKSLNEKITQNKPTLTPFDEKLENLNTKLDQTLRDIQTIKEKIGSLSKDTIIERFLGWLRTQK